AAAATAVAIAGSVPAHELAPALAALSVPRAVATVLGAALRQTSVLGEEGRRLVLARKLRGATGHVQGARVVGTLFTRAAARAERIDLAARLRGCSPARSLTRSRLTRVDAVPVAIAAVTAVSIHVAGRLLP